MQLKKLFNSAEEKTHAKLREVCEQNGVSVYPKIRVADVLPIENSGISQRDFRFALQAHFDFVVADGSHTPLFAVEFDGPLHDSAEQKFRDIRKDALCGCFGFPMLRINSAYIDRQSRGMDLLTWFIEVWFAREAFDRAQASGTIPPDEIFDPCFIVHCGNRHSFPYWLSRDALLRIQQLYKAGSVYDFAPSHIVGMDSKGNYRAISWLRVTNEGGILVRTGMRNQLFPVVISEIVGELVALDLYEALQSVLDGKTRPLALSEIDRHIKDFERAYELCSSAVCWRR